MKKKGIFGIFGTIFLIMLIALIGLFVYYYYFHVYETFTLCFSENGEDTNMSCQVDSQCEKLTSTFFRNLDFNNSPELITESFGDLINNYAYCDETCFVRDVRGFNSASNSTCFKNETQVSIDVKGKDIIETIKWIGNN